MSNPGTRKDDRLDLRLGAQSKALLQRAAIARHKTVSEFVVQSSLTAAAETLAERREILRDDVQGQSLGKGLLKDALLRTDQAADIAGIRALLVHAKDDRARAFYTRFDFKPSPTDPYHLFLLLKDLRRSL